ncbi:MAG: CARDB domain-containing protein, partial [Candidatus Thermoplasmatota archaeon]
MQEYNRGNNELEVYITRDDLRYSDLCITVNDISFSKTNPTYDEEIKIYVSVSNIGTAPSDPAYIEFYIDDIWYAQRALPSIEPSSVNITDILWEAKDNAKITVKIFPQGYDHVNTNNDATVYSPLTRKADLMINRDATILPEEIITNQTIEIVVTVYNIGNAPGEGTLTFEIDASPLKSEPTGKILENQNTTVKIIATLSFVPGIYTARLHVLNLTFDSNLNNNIVELQINISRPPTPEFRIIDIKTDPEHPEEGRGYYIIIKVLNFGNWTGDVRVIVFANEREIYNRTELAVKPNAVREVRIGCDYPHGTNITVILSANDLTERFAEGFIIVKTHPQWYFIILQYWWAALAFGAAGTSGMVIKTHGLPASLYNRIHKETALD